MKAKPRQRKYASKLTAAQYRQTASEHGLQVSVLEYLALYGRTGVFWFAVPNAGKRGWHSAMRLKAEGLTAGVADLCIMLPRGKAAWLEMKTGEGRQSLDQRAFEGVCKSLGHPYYVARTFEEAVAALRQLGAVKLREVAIR